MYTAAMPLLGFVQRPQAARADIYPAHLAINFQSFALDIRFELAFGRFFGVADVVPGLRAFATDFTFCH
jgi:hypothetical protein